MEDSAEYDKKLKELQDYLPSLESMRVRIQNNSRGRFEENARAEYLLKINTLKSFLMDTDRRMKMDNIKKCETVLIKLSQKLEKIAGADSPVHNIAKTIDSVDSLTNAKMKTISSEKNKGKPAVSMNFYKELAENTETKDNLNEKISLPITDFSGEPVSAATSELEMCRVKLQSVFKMNEQTSNKEESLFTRRLVNQSSQRESLSKVNETITSVDKSIPEKKLASERRPNYTRVLRSPNKNSPHSDRRSSSGSFSPARRRSRDRYERIKRRSPEHKKSSYYNSPYRKKSRSLSKSRNYDPQRDLRDSNREKYRREIDNYKSRRRRSRSSPRRESNKNVSKVSEKTYDKNVCDKRENQSSISKTDEIETFEIKKLNRLKSQLEQQLQENSNYDDLTDSSSQSLNNESSDAAKTKEPNEKEDGEIGETDEEEEKHIELLYSNLFDSIHEDTVKCSETNVIETVDKKPDNTRPLNTSNNNEETTNIRDLVLKSLKTFNRSKINASDNKILKQDTLHNVSTNESNLNKKTHHENSKTSLIDKPLVKNTSNETKKSEISSESIPKAPLSKKEVLNPSAAINASTSFEQDILQALSNEIKETNIHTSLFPVSESTEVKPSIKRNEPLENAQQKSRRISLETYKEKNNSLSFGISLSPGEHVQSTDLSKKYEDHKRFVSSVLTPKERERFTSILDNTVEDTIGDFDSIPKPLAGSAVSQIQPPVVNSDVINYVAPESPDSNSSFLYDRPSSPIERQSIYEAPPINKQASPLKLDGNQCAQGMRSTDNNLPPWITPNNKTYDVHPMNNLYSGVASPSNTAANHFSNPPGNLPDMVPPPTSTLTAASSSILPTSFEALGKVIECFTVPHVRQGNLNPQCSPKPFNLPNENMNIHCDNTNFRFQSPTQFFQHTNLPDQNKSNTFHRQNSGGNMRSQNIPPLMGYGFHEDVDINYADGGYGLEEPFPSMSMNPMNPTHQHNFPTNPINSRFGVGNISPLMPNNISVVVNNNFPKRKMPNENMHQHSRDPRERKFSGNFRGESNLKNCGMDINQKRLGRADQLMDMQFGPNYNEMPPEELFSHDSSLNQNSNFDRLGRHQSQGRPFIPKIPGQPVLLSTVDERMNRGRSQGRSYNREPSMGRTVHPDLGVDRMYCDQNHGGSFYREPSMGRAAILDASSDRMSRGRSQGRPLNREPSVGRKDISEFASDRMYRGRSQGKQFNREPSIERMTISDVAPDRMGREKSQGRLFNRERSIGRLDINVASSDRRNSDQSVGRPFNRRQSQRRSPPRESSLKRLLTSNSTSDRYSWVASSNREPSVGKAYYSNAGKDIYDKRNYFNKRNSFAAEESVQKEHFREDSFNASSYRSNQDKDERPEAQRRQIESQVSFEKNPKDPRNRQDDSQRNNLSESVKKNDVNSNNLNKNTNNKQRNYLAKSKQRNRRMENFNYKKDYSTRSKYVSPQGKSHADKKTTSSLATRSFSSSRSSTDSQGLKFKIPKIKKVSAEVIEITDEPVVVSDEVHSSIKLPCEEPQPTAKVAIDVGKENVTETECKTGPVTPDHLTIDSVLGEDNCAIIESKPASEIEDSVPKIHSENDSTTNSNDTIEIITPNKDKIDEQVTSSVLDADEVNPVDSSVRIDSKKTETIPELESQLIEAETPSDHISSSVQSSEVIQLDSVKLNETPSSSGTKIDDVKSLNDEVVSSIANILKDRSTMLEMLAFFKSKSGNESEKIEKIFERITELNKDGLNSEIDIEQGNMTDPSDVDKHSSVQITSKTSTDNILESTPSAQENDLPSVQKENYEQDVSPPTQKNTKTAKKYSKGNRELMMLQEDLKEMFISQGVMDAENLGFRMCRLTSDTKIQPKVITRKKRSSIVSPKPAKPIAKPKKQSLKKSVKTKKAISNINDKNFPQVSLEESSTVDKLLSISNIDSKTSNAKIYDYDKNNEDLELFITSNAAKGPCVENSKEQSIPPIKTSLKLTRSLKRAQLSVKITKKLEIKRKKKKLFMKKGKMKTKKNFRQSPNKCASNKSNDDNAADVDQPTVDQPVINDELDAVTGDEEDEAIDTTNEANVRTPAVKNIQTPIPKKKKRLNWSMGIIKKKKCAKINKSIAISPTVPDQEESVSVEPFDEKGYHFLSGSSKYSCALCKSFHGVDIVGHFKNHHPHSEILISRLHPGFAKLAINESNQKHQHPDSVPKDDNICKFQCRFCERLFSNVTSKTFFSHVTRSHTGEYKAKCNLCSKNNSTKMIHSCNKFSNLPPALTANEVFGYICGLCHYTQVSEENLKNHVSSRHSETECEIIKINLSNHIFQHPDSQSPEPMNNKILTRSKILKSDSPPNDVVTTPEKRKRISMETEIPNKKLTLDRCMTIQTQPVVVLEKSCSSGNMLKKLPSGNELKMSDDSNLTPTLKVKQETIDPTNQNTTQETYTTQKDIVMKKEPPSHTDVIADPIQTDGNTVDMGVLQITQYPNGSATYDCRIRACMFQTSFFLIFARHVKSIHNHDEWDGFCKVCSFQTIKEKYSSFVDALDHLMAHINVDSPIKVLATVKNEIVPAEAVVEVNPVQPKIQVRPLSDLMAKKQDVPNCVMEKPVTKDDFAVSEMCIENVVSLRPKTNMESSQDDNIQSQTQKKSKLIRLKYTPSFMKKSGTVVILKKTTGQTLDSKPAKSTSPANESLDAAASNSQSSEDEFEKNDLFKCAVIDCFYSTNEPKAFVDHIDGHCKSTPNFECKCVECPFICSTGFDLVLHLERAHNKQTSVTRNSNLNMDAADDNATAENPTACSAPVHANLQEAGRGNIDGILPKNSVFSRYSCTAPVGDAGKKCGITFLTPQLFLEHIKKDHRVKRIQCHECKCRPLIFWTLVYHLRLCHGYCLYACVYCGVNFDIESSVQRHLTCDHPDKRQLAYMRHIDVLTNPYKIVTEQIILLDIDPESIARSVAVKKSSESPAAPEMAAVLNSIPPQARSVPNLFPIIKRNSIETVQSRAGSPAVSSKAASSPAVPEQSSEKIKKICVPPAPKTKVDESPTVKERVKSNKESTAVPPIQDSNNSMVINLDSDEEDNVPLALTQFKIASKKNVSKDSQKNVDASKATDGVSKSVDNKESSVECIELLSDEESTPPIKEAHKSLPEKQKNIEYSSSVNTGFSGKDLYRCGNSKCSFRSTTSSEFKDHLTICDFAKEHSKLPCYHCKRKYKSNISLLDHIHNHGKLRYTCSVCNLKMRSIISVNGHMNRLHKVMATTVLPCDPFKTNIDTDEFVIKPITTEKNTRSKRVKVQLKPPQAAASPVTPNFKKLAFDPDEVNELPLTPVFSDEVHCKKCTYATKVRSNMIRHLFLHSNEISVPSAAPVNPVPSSGPKHFDSMSNLALSSNLDKAPAVRISTERQERIKSGTNIKKLENIPAYIPKKERFVCGAKSCSYISIDEMMLRHHWEALHREETVFKCAHCAQQIWAETGRRLTTGDIGDHLMLHKATLYQCNSCNFLHPLVKGIERHTIESVCNGGVPKLLRERRAWQCEICSTRTVLKSEIVQHCKQAHNVLNQFKCSLCLHYNSSKDCFFDHFKKNHSGRTVDVVSMYSKGEDPFDVSPLWWKQRKRGSGFVEEIQDKPVAKKTKIDMLPASEKITKEAEAVPQSIHCIINNLNEMDADLDIKPVLQILNTTSSPPRTSVPEHDNSQLLESMPLTKFLIELPNKVFQCTMCSEYTSKCQSDMKIHLFEELNYRKWCCEVCNYKSFDEASIVTHCMQAHRNKKIKELSPDKRIEDWVENSLTLMNNITDTPEETIEDNANSNTDKLTSSKMTSESITSLQEKLSVMNNTSLVTVPCSSGIGQINEIQDNLFTVLFDSEKNESPIVKKVADGNLETGNRAVHIPIKRGQKQKLFGCGHCSFETSAKPYVRRHHKNKHAGMEYKIITLGDDSVAVSAPPAVPSSAVVSKQERNFMCLVCETSVANLDIVQHHQSCHPNETNQVLEKKTVVYKCLLCMQLTAYLNTMTAHFEKLHPNVEKNYVMHKLGNPKFKRIMVPKETPGAGLNTKYYCRYCPRVLSDFQSLLEHHQLCHSDDLIGIVPANNSPIVLTGEISTCESILSDLYDCKISGCDYTSESTQDYLFHTRSHYVSYKCDICLMHFLKYSDYVKHKSEHANMQIKPKFAFLNNFVVRLRLRQIIDMLGKTFPSIGNIQLDHFLQTDIDDVDAPQNQIYNQSTIPVRTHQVARKSTTQIDVNPFPRLVIAEEEEQDSQSQPNLGYSNYGKKPDTDFKGITAKIPLMGRYMPFTIDKLSEIFQLFPSVLVEDCRRANK